MLLEQAKEYFAKLKDQDGKYSISKDNYLAWYFVKSFLSRKIDEFLVPMENTLSVVQNKLINTKNEDKVISILLPFSNILNHLYDLIRRPSLRKLLKKHYEDLELHLNTLQTLDQSWQSLEESWTKVGGYNAGYRELLACIIAGLEVFTSEDLLLDCYDLSVFKQLDKRSKRGSKRCTQTSSIIILSQNDSAYNDIDSEMPDLVSAIDLYMPVNYDIDAITPVRTRRKRSDALKTEKCVNFAYGVDRAEQHKLARRSSAILSDMTNNSDDSAILTETLSIADDSTVLTEIDFEIADDITVLTDIDFAELNFEQFPSEEYASDEHDASIQDKPANGSTTTTSNQMLHQYERNNMRNRMISPFSLDESEQDKDEVKVVRPVSVCGRLASLFMCGC